jgi:hypothetical protein
MSVSVSSAIAVLMCDTFTAQINVGTTVAAGYVIVYKGTVPANARAAMAGDVAQLVKLTSPADAFADAVANDAGGYAESIAGAIPNTPATADGHATFFRQYNRDNQVIYQGSVTLPNGGGEMELSSLDLLTGINAVVQSYSIRYPMG